MQTSRAELLADLLGFMGELDDADARNIAEAMVARVMQTIYLEKTWNELVSPDPWQITTVANQRTYVLPDHFGRPTPGAVMRNLTTGGKLRLIDRNSIEDAHPEMGVTGLDTTEEPCFFFVGGTQPVATQPAAAGDALEIVSDSIADTTVKVTVVGEDANGIERRKFVTVTGIGAVAVGTFRKISAFGKAYPDGVTPTTEGTSSEGSITLRKVAGAVELETLQSDESSKERLALTLYPTPDAVYTLALPFIRAPRRLVYDSDTLPRFWGPAVYEEARLEWDLNQGNLSLSAFMAAPRPRLRRNSSQHDNALAARPRERVIPFGG
jgi:hypothetical protein